AIHFNPDHPENHNVYISNIKTKYAMVHDGIKWNARSKTDTVDRIYDDKKAIIEENLDEHKNSLSVSRQNAINRWLGTDENDPKITKVKEDLKLLLYNNRDMVINAQKPKQHNDSKIYKIPKNTSKSVK